MQHPRHAPALRYRVVRSSLVAWLLGVLAVAGLAVECAWLAMGAGTATLALRVAALLLWCVCSGAAWCAWRAMPQGWLQHQGGAWWFEADTALGTAQPLQELALHLDGQLVLLVSALAAPRRRLWLWLERRQDAAQWPLLRAVLFAQRTIDTTPPTQGGL